MVAADINLQVWLETVPDTHPAVVVPTVVSKVDETLRYQVKVAQAGAGGSSSVSQGGSATVRAGQPTALSRFSLNVGAHDRCTIQLIIAANGHTIGTYQFECPR
ncbi:MAG TPA: curli-like amyloid fiber formation chaperone CsgH [Castellaniella sp.]|uniref:curli-like amyloid fiber formation chaperone CsgH n=1 Tax=Castellaniella sp. TaxID=1955812 RepID=UPI002F141A89